MPHFKELRDCEYSKEWWDEYKSMNSQGAWLELHGRSVHGPKVIELVEKRVRAFNVS
jgi:hypothetical protein